jgi:hypothetical protein
MQNYPANKNRNFKKPENNTRNNWKNICKIIQPIKIEILKSPKITRVTIGKRIAKLPNHQSPIVQVLNKFYSQVLNRCIYNYI